MTRLTNDIRNSIRQAAIESTFSPLRKEHAAAEGVLAVEAYNSVFSEVVRQAIACVPAHWFRNDPCLNFNVNGMRIKLSTDDGGLPVPYESGSGRGYHCHSETGTIMAGDLADRIKLHAIAGEELRNREKSASRNMDNLLASISSIAKLKAAWPEGSPFYARFLSATPPNLPAIRFTEVNALLGIPSREAAE